MTTTLSVNTNGRIVTDSGSKVTIGTIESDSISEFSDPDTGVDRVAGTGPSSTGRLQVVDGTTHVDGHGDVVLTNANGTRTVDTVGGTSGNDADLLFDSNNRLKGQYTVTETNTEIAGSTTQLSDGDQSTTDFSASFTFSADQTNRKAGAEIVATGTADEINCIYIEDDGGQVSTTVFNKDSLFEVTPVSDGTDSVTIDLTEYEVNDPREGLHEARVVAQYDVSTTKTSTVNLQ